MAPKAAADFTITIASNIWVGSGSWHTNENWIFDPFNPDMPRTGLPTYIHVAENFINGVPSGQFYTPSGPAVVSSDFTSTSSLTMASWDGPSILTINSGATLTFVSATVGAPINHNNTAPSYVPSGPIQPATVNLAGAINGNWTFTADSVLNLMPGWSILGSASVNGTVNNHTAVATGSLTNFGGSPAGWNNIGAGSALTVDGNYPITLGGASMNEGTISLLGSSSTGVATLALDTSNPVTLSGGGQVVLADSNYSRIGQGFNGELITNIDNFIRGAGTISAAIVNQSTIRAEGGTLTFNRAVDNNAGIIEIASDGTLGGGGSAIITGGGVNVEPGAVFVGGNLTAATITGDLLATGGTLRDTTLASLSSIKVQDAGFLVLRDMLINQGTLTVLGSAGNGMATLGLNATGLVTLTGGGELVLSDGTYSRIGQGFNGEHLVNTDNIIRGSGSINGALTNQSIIRAEGGTLTLSKAVTNSGGTIQIASDGTLGGNTVVTGGSIQSASGAVLNGPSINSAIFFGDLDAIGGRIEDSTLTASSTLDVPGGGGPQIGGAIENQATITVFGSASTGTARLAVNPSNPVTLTGGGEVVLTDGNYSQLGQGFNGESISNVDNTIRGAGTISAAIVNQSTIRAEGGTLRFNKPVDNTGGVFEVAAGGILDVSYGLLGGTLATDSGGTINGLLHNVTSTSTLSIPGGAYVVLQESFINLGTVSVLGSGATGTATLGINTSGPVMLTGGGEVALGHNAYSRIGQGFAGEQLINVDNTIRGTGNINASLINQALVRAEGGTLRINKPIDNAAGVFEVAADGNLDVAYGLVGGTLTTDPAGAVEGLLRNVTSSSILSIRGGAYLALQESFINLGTVSIIGSGATGTATLGINTSDPPILSGGGEVVLGHSAYSRIGQGFAGEQLTNVDNTIRGEGNINALLTNHAILRAQGGVMTLNRDLLGSGDTYIDAGATLTFNGGTLHQQALTIDPTGTFDFNGSRLEVVDFAGDFIHDQGIYAPGASPAEASLNGDYTMANTFTTLEIEIGGTALGEFDQLTVSGAVDLNGKLSIVSLPSYVPSAGDTFVVLKALGGLTGDFSTISGQIIGEGPGPGYQIILDYTSGTVTLQTTLPGDLDGDGFVGIADLNLVLGNWNLNVPPGDPLADPSGDGFVGIADLNVVLGNWNGDFPPATGAAAIPEPGMVGLIGLGVATLARQRTRWGA